MARIVNDNVAVFDLDGCVSDDRWRRERIPDGASHPLEYDFYHAGCGADPVLTSGAVRLNEHISAGHFIAFATARPFKVAELTATWLKDNFGLTPNKDFMILMRKSDDIRSSVEVKQEMVGYLRQYEKDSGRTVVSLYDDRQDIVDMYIAQGFTGVHRLDENGLHTPAEKPTNPPLRGVLIDGQAATLAEVRERGLGQPIDEEALEEFERGADPQDECADEEGLRDASPSHVHPNDAADNLKRAYATFVNRQQTYGPNDIIYAQVMKVLFPGKVVLASEQDHRMFLMVMHAVGKLTRFTSSGMTHSDSAHDLINYAAFMELLAAEHNIEVI